VHAGPSLRWPRRTLCWAWVLLESLHTNPLQHCYVTAYPVNREKVGRDGREGSEGQSRKEEETEGWIGTGQGGQGPVTEKGAICLDISARDPEFLVTPLLAGQVRVLSQGRFDCCSTCAVGPKLRVSAPLTALQKRSYFYLLTDYEGLFYSK